MKRVVRNPYAIRAPAVSERVPDRRLGPQRRVDDRRRSIDGRTESSSAAVQRKLTENPKRSQRDRDFSPELLWWH